MRFYPDRSWADEPDIENNKDQNKNEKNRRFLTRHLVNGHLETYIPVRVCVCVYYDGDDILRLNDDRVAVGPLTTVMMNRRRRVTYPVVRSIRRVAAFFVRRRCTVTLIAARETDLAVTMPTYGTYFELVKFTRCINFFFFL